MSDLISRQEAIGGICDYSENMSVEYKVFADAAKRMLLNLPSVNCSEKPNNWIPVTERLPEELYAICCDDKGEILIATPFECEDSDTGFSAESDECYMYNVVAWKPLPEPYKEET